MTQTVSQAVAQRDNSPHAMVATYSGSFARVLPAHIKPDAWVRLTQGALKRGRIVRDKRDPNFGRYELEVAAENNPRVFLASLLDAARQGLEPGTEQYYLTPRKVGGQLEILGIVGYQGYIDLMYRAGGVTSVVVQVVRERDEYEFVRGQLDRPPPGQSPRWDGPQVVPWHKIAGGNFARDEVRGPLVGVYAYAWMRGGGVSQVVELNADHIARIKAVNPASGSEYSPWVNWEESMWLKSAARQLRKWVPTSAEYRQAQATVDVTAREVAVEHELPPAPVDGPDVLDGEVVEQAQNDWPPDDPDIDGGAA